MRTEPPHSVARATAGLPAQPNDWDWDTATDLLFEDHDVLMLFDKRLDGIDAPDNGIHQQLGMVNLRPDTWFLPFHETDPAPDPTDAD